MRCSTSGTAVAAAGALALLAASAASSQGTPEPSAAASRGVMQDRSHASAAEALYVEKCSMCHRNMGMGTVLLARRMDPAQAPLEQRDNLTPQFVETVVRNGILNMPPIPKGEVSDEELEIIAAYLAEGPRQ